MSKGYLLYADIINHNLHCMHISMRSEFQTSQISSRFFDDFSTTLNLIIKLYKTSTKLIKPNNVETDSE